MRVHFNISLLVVFISETDCVLCAARTESENIGGGYKRNAECDRLKSYLRYLDLNEVSIMNHRKSLQCRVPGRSRDVVCTNNCIVSATIIAFAVT